MHIILREIFNVLYTIGLIGNAGFYIPQARRMYKTKSNTGVSLTTFIGFNLIAVVSILNGFSYDDPSLIIGKIASWLMSLLIIFLFIRYRK